ncbi:hypothetical protein KKF82_07685 [Patescibacteria group bacterium]|nr:hypothetical protein [Patescibacteria group bacterium]
MWEDPLALAQAPEAKVQINAQQRANERARRLGKPIPYQAAEMQFRPAPTKEEIQHGWDLEGREFQARQHTQQDELKILRGEGDRLAAEVAAIDKESGGHYTATGRAAREKLEKDLAALNEDRDKSGHLDPLEWSRARAQMYGKYLRNFNRTEHVTPLERRPDYETVTPSGRLIRQKPDGTYEDVGLAPRHMLDPEQQKATAAQRESNIITVGGRQGQYRQDKYGEYFDPLPEPKAAPSHIDNVAEFNRQYILLSDYYDSLHPDAIKNDPKYEKARDTFARTKITVQVEPRHGIPEKPAAPGAPAGGQAGPPTEDEVTVGPEGIDVPPREPGRSSFPGAGGGIVPQEPAASPPQPTAQPSPFPSIGTPSPDGKKVSDGTKWVDYIPDQPEPAETQPAPKAVTPPVAAGQQPAGGTIEATPVSDDRAWNEREGVQKYGKAVPESMRLKGKAADQLYAKGYDYVPLLNSQGEETGQFSWRPPEGLQPHEIVPYGKYQTGKITKKQAEQQMAAKPFSFTGPATSVVKQPAAAGPAGQQANRKISPDGKWEWDGTKWVSIGGR